MANDFSNSQNSKPTFEDNKPRKQKNQATIPSENIKPQRALVPRSTNPSLGSHSDAEIIIFGFRFLLRCQDIMNLCVWVVASASRFDESVEGTRGKGRTWRTKEERKKWRIETRVLCGSIWKIVHIRCFPALELEDLRLVFHPKLELLFSNFVLPMCPLTKF